MGGTWRTKGAVESDGGDTVVGGEVERASPPVAQTEINSVKEATKNCELVLVDMVD